MTQSIRYLLRPRKFLTTPKRIAEAVGAERVVHTGRMGDIEFDPDVDLIMAWPRNLNMVPSIKQEYEDIFCFYNADKAKQRKYLSASWGIPVPGSGFSCEVVGKWVKRPLIHYGGQDFEIIECLPKPDVGPEHYVAPLFRKTHEYRLIFVCGEMAVMLTKQMENKDPSVPWNHTNGSRFVTTTAAKASIGSRIANIVWQLKQTPLVKKCSIIAFDVMWNKDFQEWCVLEANFAPAITVDSNLESIAELLKRGWFVPSPELGAEGDPDDADFDGDYEFPDEDYHPDDDYVSDLPDISDDF